MLVSDMVNISPAPERTEERIILYASPCMALDEAHFTKTKELFFFFSFSSRDVQGVQSWTWTCVPNTFQ